jgi:hypothetical protein
MTEQLLDRAQVGSALQQMGGEGVAERVRRDPTGDRGLAHPAVEPPTHVGGREPPSPDRDEERGLGRIPHEPRAARREVALEGALGRLPHRQQTLLLALARDPHRLRLEVDPAEIEGDDLLAAEAAGVGELEHGPIAKLQRLPRRDPVQQGAHLLSRENPGQLALALGTGDQLGWIRRYALAAHEEVVEPPQGGELARHARPGQPALGEPGHVATDVAIGDVLGAQPAPGRPPGELRQVDRVGPPGAGRRGPPREVAVVVLEAGLPIHVPRFAAAGPTPAQHRLSKVGTAPPRADAKAEHAVGYPM